MRRFIKLILLFVGLPSAFLNFLYWGFNIVGLVIALAVDGDKGLPTDGLEKAPLWFQLAVLPIRFGAWLDLGMWGTLAMLVCISAIIAVIECFHFAWVSKELEGNPIG